MNLLHLRKTKAKVYFLNILLKGSFLLDRKWLNSVTHSGTPVFWKACDREVAFLLSLWNNASQANSVRCHWERKAAWGSQKKCNSATLYGQCFQSGRLPSLSERAGSASTACFWKGSLQPLSVAPIQYIHWNLILRACQLLAWILD